MNVDFLQQLCGNWPGVTTDVKWGNDFVFSVAEKMFCVCSLEQPPKIAFKVNDEDFEELSVRDGFMPAPYMARNKWVLITHPGKLTRKEWEEFVRQSYELIKSKLSKKLQEKLEKVQGTKHKAQEGSKVKGTKSKEKKGEGTRHKLHGTRKAQDPRSKSKGIKTKEGK
jgi:predicted DNA-binding protein (MmcQ/YjbR family)